MFTEIPVLLARALKLINKSPSCIRWVLFKALHFLGLRMTYIVCCTFKSRVSISYGPLALLELSPTDYQNQMCYGGLFFQWRSAGQGVPQMGLDSLTPQGGPVCLWYSLYLWVSYPRVWFLTTSLTHSTFLMWLFLLSLAMKQLFCLSQVVFTVNCTICSCRFDVSVRESELKILLLFHLPNHPWSRID